MGQEGEGGWRLELSPAGAEGQLGRGAPQTAGPPPRGPKGPPEGVEAYPRPKTAEDGGGGGAGDPLPPQPQSGKTPSPISSHSLFHSADQTQANGAARTSERCRVRARAAAAKGAASRTSERCWVLAIVQQDTSRARGRSIINTNQRISFVRASRHWIWSLTSSSTCSQNQTTIFLSSYLVGYGSPTRMVCMGPVSQSPP